MKNIKVGLVAGRHSMPVDGYIFDEIKDVLDFDFLDNGVKKFINSLPVMSGELNCNLDIYVTGLTSVTISLLSNLKDLKFDKGQVKFYHFDRDTNTYKAQII